MVLGIMVYGTVSYYGWKYVNGECYDTIKSYSPTETDVFITIGSPKGRYQMSTKYGQFSGDSSGESSGDSEGDVFSNDIETILKVSYHAEHADLLTYYLTFPKIVPFLDF